ncbi:MAG TPA: YihY/virulence factor BrkB family protein [Roseiarcus sp.]|nr:YihY/virulence factor BrkB family protein [Roseiarcus sp.]
MRRIGKIFGIFLDAYWRFLAQDGWAIASYMGLSALTSMFPFLIFVTALAGFFGTDNLAEEAARLIFAVWPKEVAGPIAGEVQSVLTAPRGGLLTIGAALALYFASGAIEAARVGLNRAYGSVETRPWWLLRLESIAFVVVAAFGLLALAFLVVLGPLIWSTTLRYLPQLAPLGFLVTFIRLGAAVVLMAITLFLAHILLPRGRRRLIDLAPGVALTFTACIAFGEVFGAYLSEYARSYVSTYAGLASVMIALVFLYAMSGIFIYGGELNAAIMRAREATKVSGGVSPKGEGQG